jgi:HEAT repeat protein
MLDATQLVSDIASGDHARREEATEVIGRFECDTDVDVSVFVAALAATDEDVVFWSAVALEHLGERGSAAIPILLRLLERKQLFLRQSAVKALAAVGPTDRRAKIGILSCFADHSPFVRREALQACIQLRDLSVDEFAAIAGMATDSDEAVARWSEIALRNLRIREQEKG